MFANPLTFREPTSTLRLPTLLVGLLAVAAIAPAWASSRVPGDQWQRYENVVDAGFDAAKLGEARESWEALPSSAFMVITDGAVVASWGDVTRRFMCHSVRKSFLSALYGIYWDRGEIELNKTLGDLGIDDEPSPLLESEKRARVLDLLKARSGVFHPAAYAGRTDSRPRGSEGPGRYFGYNNWDFNTLAAILTQETGADVFEAFDEHFGQPLQMDDWRVTDGYYHYERDKSKYPAYPFRMSARDAARFGLLFAREGAWGDAQVLSKNWVRRSSALYSIDDEVMGYGLMWWVLRQPRFSKHGIYAALGVGNQMIAVIPELDMVIVNRANTFAGERTPMEGLLDLIEQVIEARVGTPRGDARLGPLPIEAKDAESASLSREALQQYVGEFDYPPETLGLDARTTVKLEFAEGHLVATSPASGTFELYLQPDGSFLEEDSHERYLGVHHPDGRFAGIADTDTVLRGSLQTAIASGNSDRALELLALLEDGALRRTAEASLGLLIGEHDSAEEALRRAVTSNEASEVEAYVNLIGYRLLGLEHATQALAVFEANTNLFPEASNPWDSLGEARLALGQFDEAEVAYERSLKLDPSNENAGRTIQRIGRLRLGKEYAESLDAIVPDLLEEYRVPGAAVAVVQDGNVVLVREYGVRRAGGDAAVDSETIFQAASLSKPVVAYGAHVLARDGKLDLDRPLSDYLEEPYVEELTDDPRLNKITARMVLSHSGGFPNWRPRSFTTDPGPLKILFEPGSDFRYSGEGYLYLQRVIETISGETLDVFLRRAVLEPLGMARSSFVWEERFEAVFATPHDAGGQPREKRKPARALAAGTLHTTAADYARLLRALLVQADGGEPLNAKGVATMLTKTSSISDRLGKDLGWSLGLGVESAGNDEVFFQWGDDGPFKAFAAGSRSTGAAVVVLTNGQWGLDVARPIVERVLGKRNFLDFRMVNYRPRSKG